MKLSHFRDLLVLLTLSFDLSIHVATSLDTITSSYILKGPETLSSNDDMFQLGFFTTNSTFSYLGIRYTSKPPLVWVANRDQPLKNSSDGALKISEDGNLVLMNGQNHKIWSTNVPNIAASNATIIAQLLNTGNLVLQENTTGRILWQSFEHPTDTLLQKMQIKTNRISGEKVKLTSWKSPQDPSIGDFSLSLEYDSIREAFTWRGNQPYWRSGPWNGQVFLGIQDMRSNYLDGFYSGMEDVDKNGTVYVSFNYANQSIIRIFMLSSGGNFYGKAWDYAKGDWYNSWSAINSECDVYGMCGAFGKCDPTSSPICNCLVGYEPRNAEEWNRQNWSSGCVRKLPLKCERSVTNGSEAGGGSNNKDDGFVKLQNAKVPDFALWSSSNDDCATQCLRNCSCIAYAYDAGIGCMLWSGNLTDIQIFSSGGTDLYIRVPYSELGEEKNKVATVIIAVSVTVGTIIIVACAFILWKRTIRDKSKLEIWKWKNKDQLSEVKLPELSQYEFKRLALATNNFCLPNKLGQGGFGQVYKGTLEDGQEIAVKRLSTASGQGLEEFMNEVTVISKLQHRNLVKLLGCCIERDEKILIYEYMPNRSLDAYMFDPLKHILDWETRFNIIKGIVQGLLYLHRDSRLKIIHRDLKLSNILLDEELNPKISDFGLAKIFDRVEDGVNTRRIVGTYGYMSPEYAMEGLFSEKSDIFSFGVLMLELIYRRKNTSFYGNDESFSLLGFVWRLWNAHNVTSLIDREISNPSNNADIMRCIHIGLLCVQELARDRPTMTAVISMLNSETVNLPPPKQPGFIQRQTVLEVESSLRNGEGSCSINYASLTDIRGR